MDISDDVVQNILTALGDYMVTEADRGHGEEMRAELAELFGDDLGFSADDLDEYIEEALR